MPRENVREIGDGYVVRVSVVADWAIAFVSSLLDGDAGQERHLPGVGVVAGPCGLPTNSSLPSKSRSAAVQIWP